MMLLPDDTNYNIEYHLHVTENKKFNCTNCKFSRFHEKYSDLLLCTNKKMGVSDFRDDKLITFHKIFLNTICDFFEEKNKDYEDYKTNDLCIDRNFIKSTNENCCEKCNFSEYNKTFNILECKKEIGWEYSISEPVTIGGKTIFYEVQPNFVCNCFKIKEIKVPNIIISKFQKYIDVLKNKTPFKKIETYTFSKNKKSIEEEKKEITISPPRPILTKEDVQYHLAFCCNTCEHHRVGVNNTWTCQVLSNSKYGDVTVDSCGVCNKYATLCEENRDENPS